MSLPKPAHTETDRHDPLQIRAIAIRNVSRARTKFNAMQNKGTILYL
ncbi:MAG TPA: hypothetical protein V6C84_03710 [Coleofasciculaceae cyanobacterium]